MLTSTERDRNLLMAFRAALVMEDTCPECLSPLRPDMQCSRCDYNAAEEFDDGEESEAS